MFVLILFLSSLFCVGLGTVGYAVFAFFASPVEEIEEHQVSDYEFLVYNQLHAEAVNS